jgi:hypothetical protein
MTKQQPEALATFAQASRKANKKRPDIEADEHTKPIPADPKIEHKAATKVLQEGVTGKDSGADEEINRLPDRIVDSR